MFKKSVDNILSKVEKAKPMIIPRDNTLDDCKLVHEKEYPFYGQQYASWINEDIQRVQVLAKMKNGDAVDFRPAPWKDGTMFLCLDRKSGLDFGVLVNNVARKLMRDYYGCFMVGIVSDRDNGRIMVQVWQPPENL